MMILLRFYTMLPLFIICLFAVYFGLQLKREHQRLYGPPIPSGNLLRSLGLVLSVAVSITHTYLSPLSLPLALALYAAAFLLILLGEYRNIMQPPRLK